MEFHPPATEVVNVGSAHKEMYVKGAEEFLQKFAVFSSGSDFSAS